MVPSSPEPKIGILYFLANLRALFLLPNERIDFALGPINLTFYFSKISANFSLSLRKPYPGCTASAPVIFIALSMLGIFR